MNPLYLLNRAFWILALGGVIALVGWPNAHDRQVERASLEAYCTGVAVWSAEASRGIAPERRTGHPDWRGNAAEVCPGMRPADPANSSEIVTRSTERQLARQ